MKKQLKTLAESKGFASTTIADLQQELMVAGITVIAVPFVMDWGEDMNFDLDDMRNGTVWGWYVWKDGIFKKDDIDFPTYVGALHSGLEYALKYIA